MSSLNDLLRQSETTLEVIADLQKLLKDAQDKVNEGSFDDRQMYYLKVAFNRTLTLTNLYLKNFNEFMSDQNN